MLLNRRSILKSIPLLLSGKLFAAPLPNNKALLLRFAVASDGHFGQPGTDYLKYHDDLISWLTMEKMQRKLDFIVLNGDLVHDKPTLFYDLKTTLSRLPTQYYVTRGNHDKVDLDVWESLWGYSTNHAFEKENYGFILLDTSNAKGEYVCPDADWLATALQKYQSKAGIFVFMHITPSKWTANGIDCPDIRNLLEKTPNVKAIFHGHDHDQDSQKNSGGKPYFFDGHFGGSWGTHYKGYRIVEIYYDATWKTFQYNPSAEPMLNVFEAR